MASAIRSSIPADLYRLDAPMLAEKRPLPALVGTTGIEVDWRPLNTLDAADIARWRDLVRRALEPNVFLEPAFARAAAAHLPGPDIGVLLVRAGSRLLGLLPGHVEGLAHGRPVATFRVWTHPFAPLSTPLVDREAAADVVAAMLEALPKLPGSPRLALFPHIDEQGPVAGLLAECLGQSGRAACRLDPHQRAALVCNEGHPLGAVGAKKLKELRRQRRRLAEVGTLTRDTITATDAIGAAVADYLTVETHGWKMRAGGAAKLDAASARFLTEAVAGLAAEGKARIDLLKLGAAIAATITLFSGNRAWFWKTAYDEDFARYSPGVQLALDLSEALGQDPALALVDSCAVADHPMIDHLWGGRLAIADWLLPLGGRGLFMAGIAAERMRRAIVSPLKALRARLLH
jgi:CelD/BcsL family acetyltransferase involved in cellulose biosynthesis